MWTFQCVAAIITTCFITKGCIMTPFSLMPFPHTVCVLLPIHLSLIFSIVLAFLGPAHCRQHNVAEASVTMATTIACWEMQWGERSDSHVKMTRNSVLQDRMSKRNACAAQYTSVCTKTRRKVSGSLLLRCLFLLLWGLLGSSFWSIWIYLDQHWLLCNCSVFDPTSIGSMLFC